MWHLRARRWQKVSYNTKSALCRSRRWQAFLCWIEVLVSHKFLLWSSLQLLVWIDRPIHQFLSPPHHLRSKLQTPFKGVGICSNFDFHELKLACDWECHPYTWQDCWFLLWVTVTSNSKSKDIHSHAAWQVHLEFSHAWSEQLMVKCQVGRNLLSFLFLHFDGKNQIHGHVTSMRFQERKEGRKRRSSPELLERETKV